VTIMKKSVRAGFSAGWIVLSMALAGCAVTASEPPTTGAAQAMTAGELATALGAGAKVVEIDLVGDGTLTACEVELEQGENEEYVEARVLSIDPAGTLVVDFDGLAVSFGDSTRFRTETESHASRDGWTAEISQALAASSPVHVRASRPLPAAPSDPNDAKFFATDLRIEEAAPTKVEMLLDDGAFVASSGGGSLTVLGRTVAMSSSTQIWSGDVDDDGTDDVGDANGAEDVGDDNGVDAEDVGDDHGADDGPGHD
jgi:hypothetical protein